MHTLYSDGRADIMEMAEAAHLKGLREIGIADHGPANIGTGVKVGETYLQIKDEVKIWTPNNGRSQQILWVAGNWIQKNVIKELDYLLVGLHPFVKPNDFGTAWSYVLGNQLVKVNKGLKEKVKNINTKTLIASLYEYNVLAVTHPGLKMEVDYQELARACIKTDTALEINTGHNFQASMFYHTR